MGQAVSSGNISSIFTWSSSNPRTVASTENCQDYDAASSLELNEDLDVRQQKHFNTFSCFRSQETVNEAHEDNLDCNNMPSSKKCYNFCNDEGEDDINECCHVNNAQNSNHSCVKHYDTARSAQTEEINGNQIDSVQSCSNENAANRNATSINRYVSAFTERVEKMSLKDDAVKETGGFKTLNVKSKRKKGNLRECNTCSKESKNNNKSGMKKKNTWMRFGSKLGKVNSAKASSSDTCSSTPDSDTTCICTSYKKVEDGASKQEKEAPPPEHPVIRHNLTLGWACERVNMNRNSSPSWGVFSSGASTYNQPSRECISCEGSHCHMDLNTLAELSNMSQLPINITVTRVATQRSYAVPGSAEGNVILLSLATQNPPVIDLRRLNTEEHPVEDCEERARVRRALEIAEGVEPPPGYNSPHIQVMSPGELRALLFQQQMPSAALLTTQPIPQRARIHTQVDYIHCLVPDLRSITGCSFYWGKMDRYEAERLLDGKPEGTFLLRDSAQEEYLFSVSFRKYQRSLHARIEQFNHKFSFDSHDPGVFASDTVTGLIEHYKDPTCVMFFEPMLTAPLSRTFTFPLQHLCRAVIVSCTTYDGINELRLPTGIKTYLKEYHYRQRVRVKRFDESPESSEESQ